MNKVNQKIPDGWKKKNFQECFFVSKKIKGVKKIDYLNFGNYPIIDQGKKIISGYISDESKLSKISLPVIVFGDHTRIIKFIDFDCALGADGIKTFYNKGPEQDLKFLYYSLLNKNIPNTGYNRHFKILAKFIFLLPPLPQQKKIVQILSTVDDEIAKTDKIITETKNLKKGLMQDLFSKGIGHTKFKKTKLGMIPEEWEVLELSTISNNLDHKRIPITKNKRQNGEIPYYGASGIIDYVNSYVFDENLLLIAEDGANLITRVLPIAFSIYGKTWVNNHAHVLKFKSNFTQKFVENYLNSHNLEKYLTGTAQPKLNQKKLSKIEIPTPLLKEQIQIVSILSGVNDKIRINQEIKKQLTQLKKGLIQELLSGRKLVS